MDAVDGRRILPSEYQQQEIYSDELAHAYEGGTVSSTNIALTLSHFMVWRKITESDHAYSLVLEDDAIFVNSHFQALSFERISDGSDDIVLLDSYVKQRPPQGHIWGNHYTLESFRGCTGGYLISKEAAHKLLKVTLAPICHPIDGLFHWYNRHVVEKNLPWESLELKPLNFSLVYPRPIINGSLVGFWPSSISHYVPDYM
jgi:GR25 family glycosyltransferase involved in LPS biosynthesis